MAFRPSRRILIPAALVVAGILGLEARAQTAPIAAPKVAKAGAHEGAIPRLTALLEAGEKAAEAEDWETVAEKVDEVEVLVADWSAEILRRPDVAPLIERLRALERQAEQEDENGLKAEEEVVTLSPAELKAEREHVLAAEDGAHFDFPIDLNDKVLTWVNLFTTGRLKNKIETSLSRGSSYLPMIRQVFAEEGIPQDLAFLPIVESGYLNHARSYAKAVGMWQFMRATGRMYGLTANAWVEERKDPVKATRAAARLLKNLYERDGDWYLALVGYNAGPGTTDRAVQNLGSRNFWDMARSRWLRDQTKSYVPQMCAAVLVGRFPERYGLKITQEVPFAYETVEVDRVTSLAVLARYAGTDLERIKALNPELLRASTPPGKYLLRVPPGTAQVTARALARIPSRERVDFQTYVVRKGDTLARVAARFKVTPADLLEANGLKASQFKAGRRLQVPPPATSTFAKADPGQASQPAAARPLEPLPTLPSAQAPTPVAAPAPQPPADTPAKAAASAEAAPAPPPVVTPAQPERVHVRPRTHRVKPGETLFSIGQRYGVELDDLRKWNRIKKNRIHPGQVLRLQK